MKTNLRRSFVFLASCCLIMCQSEKDTSQLRAELQKINISRGDIALCGSGQFGDVDFSLSCEQKVREDFNLATSLLHSFEYAEAEKVFAKVIDADPQCLMAYWGVAMSNFHPLWSPPTTEELVKGSRTIMLARSLESDSERETQYLEAVAAMFDDFDKLDHKTRLQKFLAATEALYKKYPDDKEAAVFHALALRASADPTDKTFEKQKRAGAILESLFPNEPDHPGIAHYLIHTYDYPELADLALPAARKYAAIASKSAHAQHMPSHIFTRLGLWDESIQSNLTSTDAAKCYAEKLGKEGHWDQELHGIDYLVYAYLQKAQDQEAKQQIEYLATIKNVFPLSFVDAYTFAAAPVRYAIERKDWKSAASLVLQPAEFPWDNFKWQKGIHHFGRLLGQVHLNNIADATLELQALKSIQSALVAEQKMYEANQIQIQVKSGEAWIQFMSRKNDVALRLMNEAADMEDATEKHSVTPGEVAPARELLGEMYLATGDYAKARDAFVANLKNRPNRFNSVYGAAVAARKAGDQATAQKYFDLLVKQCGTSARPELNEAKTYLKGT